MRKGFTLIELLVAIVIFSFLIALAAFSFRFYSDVVRKIAMPYPENAVGFTYLENAINSMFVFVGQKKNITGRKQFYIVFDGSPNSMEFVTSDAYGVEGIAICRVAVDNGSLVMGCSPIYNKLVDYKRPTILSKLEKRVIVKKDVSSIRIMYFKGHKKLSRLREDIPGLILMNVQSGKKRFTWYFNVRTNFSNKKMFTEYFYAPL